MKSDSIFLENGWRRKFQDVSLEGTEVIAGSPDFCTQVLEGNVSFLLTTSKLFPS